MSLADENKRQEAELAKDRATVEQLRNVEELVTRARRLPIVMALGALRALEFMAGRSAGPIAQKLGDLAAKALEELSGPDGS